MSKKTRQLKELPLSALLVAAMNNSLQSKKEKAEVAVKLFRTREDVVINNQFRTVTVAIVIDTTGKLRVGYAIQNEEDAFDAELGKTIALGRALNDKTNLSDKYTRLILNDIAESVFDNMGDGKIKIKGVK